MNARKHPRPLQMMAVLVFAVFCTMAGRVVFSPLMPSLQAEMGFSLSVAGTLFLLVSIGYGAAMLGSGFVSARFGHGMTIVAALAAVTGGLLTAAIASTVAPLAAGMLLIGAGAGTYPPSGLVMINRAISAERRSAAFALHEVGPSLAFLAAPLFVLAFEPLLGWRGVAAGFAALTATAAAAFLRWGVAGSGVGAAPSFGTVGAILRLRSTLLGMAILSAALGGLHGVYSILPAYLVSDHDVPPSQVNLLLASSRVAGILLLLRAGAIINRFGRRKTIGAVLLFSAVFTALIGFTRGQLLSVIIVMQPALMTALFPATLSSLALIGDSRYQNVTYGLIITVAIGVGTGLVPALLGLSGDLGLGSVGFLTLGLAMALVVLFLQRTPEFGREARAGTGGCP